MRFSHLRYELVFLSVLFSPSYVLQLGYPASVLEETPPPISKAGLSEALEIGGLTLEELGQLIQERALSFKMSLEAEADFVKKGATPELIRTMWLHDSFPIPEGPPLGAELITTLLQAGVPSQRVEKFVIQRGAGLELTSEAASRLESAGATRELLGTVFVHLRKPVVTDTELQETSHTNEPPPKDYDSLVRDANEALNSGAILELMAILETSKELNSERPEAYSLAGYASLYHSNNVGKAAAEYQAALDRGGSVRFRVQHPHRGFWRLPVKRDSCEGILILSNSSVSFAPDDQLHKFEATRGQINGVKVKGANFEIAISSGESTEKYTLRSVRESGRKEDARLIVAMLRR